MRPPVRLSSAALSVAILLIVFPSVSFTADTLADLSRLGGSWLRSPDLSEDANDDGRGKRTHPPFVGPATPGGPMGGSGVRAPLMGGRGPRPDPAEAERTRMLMRFATDVPDHMAIHVEGRDVTITSMTGRVMHLRADGKKTVEVSDIGLELVRRTKWDDGALVTEFKAKGGGGEGKHVYKRQGSRLTLFIAFDGDTALRTVKAKHVYELQEP